MTLRVKMMLVMAWMCAVMTTDACVWFPKPSSALRTLWMLSSVLYAALFAAMFYAWAAPDPWVEKEAA